MCVALYRALQYEKGDRKWSEGFKSCILDMGFTAYDMHPSRDPSTGSRTRVFNIKRGAMDCKKFLMICLYTVCPVLPMIKVQDELNRKRGRAGGIFTKVAGVSVMILFVTWFVLMFVDYAPLSENATVWGSVMGDANTLEGNTKYYVSNRWGYYHQYANKDSERSPGDRIVYNTVVNTGAQEQGVSATINGQATSVGVGERFAFNYRIAVIGWFFFFMFVMYLVSLRSDVRVVMKIQGTLIEDFLVCLFWPLALWQMQDTILNGELPSKKVDAPAVSSMDQI